MLANHKYWYYFARMVSLSSAATCTASESDRDRPPRTPTLSDCFATAQGQQSKGIADELDLNRLETHAEIVAGSSSSLDRGYSVFMAGSGAGKSGATATRRFQSARRLS